MIALLSYEVNSSVASNILWLAQDDMKLVEYIVLAIWINKLKFALCKTLNTQTYEIQSSTLQIIYG